jgi:hypothetical protein
MDESDWKQIYQKALEQFMDIFITPEVVRRQEIGELPKPLNLTAAQIIFFPDGARPEIRINSEVQAIGKIKLKSGINKEPGEPIFENELEGVEEITLTDSDDPDCGHATMLKINDRWLLAFDFIYNKARAKRHIAAAEEFITAAEFSKSKNHWIAFVDNLFSAAELLAKATLLAHLPDPKFMEKSSHKAIHSRYNRFANLGNIEPDYAKAFNKLSGIRYRARYLEGEYSFDDNDAQSYLDTIKDMVDITRKTTRADTL